MLCPISSVNEVKDEEMECCVICRLTGRLFESYLLNDERANMLTKIRELPRVTSAQVWHVGANLFQLGVMLDDGRLIVPGWAVETQLGRVLNPAIPPASERWGVAVTDVRQDEMSTLAGLYDDEELIEVIERIADNKLDERDVPDLGEPDLGGEPDLDD